MDYKALEKVYSTQPVDYYSMAAPGTGHHHSRHRSSLCPHLLQRVVTIGYLTLTLLVTMVTAYGQGTRGYLIAVPNVIIRNSTARICTTFHDILDDVTITFKLRCMRRKTTYTQIESFPNGIDKCIDLQVPPYINKAKADITARVTLAGSSPSENPPEYHRQVMVASRDYMVIIQTDKPLYKPGQKVRIRILSLTLDLRPKQENIVLVFLEDPDGYRLIEWRDVPTTVGLAELEYPLAEGTTLGNWKLIVQPESDSVYTEMKMFSVAHYVLPEFEASLEAPKFLPADGSSFDVRVCAKYIYGKEVVGNFTLVYCTRHRNCHNINGQLKGCGQASVPWYPDVVSKPNELSSITLYVNVTDIHTGLTMMSGKHLVHSNGGRVTVDLVTYSPPYFKPGIPYSGKAVLRFLSGEPAEGAKLSLSVWHDGDPPDGARKKRHRVTYSADHKGEVLFTLPSLSKRVNNFQLRAQASTRYATRMLMKSTEALEFTVQRWYSPSNSYLQMESQHHLGTCISSLTINTTLLMPPGDGGSIRLHYQMLTDRGVLDTGIKDFTTQLDPTSVVRRRPVQRASETVETGAEIIERQFHDRWTDVAMIPNPYERISRYGHVVQWRLYSDRWVNDNLHESMFLQVWRKDRDGSSVYILVGQTRISYSDKGTYVKALEGQERIRVAPGDVIGIYFPRKNTVPFSIRECSDNSGGDKTLYARSPVTREPGDATSFLSIVARSWIPCRQYSIRAVVEVDDGLASEQQVDVIPRHFMLDILTTKPLPPVTHLMLYYVTDDGEVVADVIRLDASPCYDHKVSLHAVPTSGGGGVPYPGDNVTMEIRAEPGSLCALGVVDRSIHVMEEPSYLSIDTMYKRISQRIPEVDTPREECDTELLDAQKAFEMAGLSVMTNLNVKTRPCVLPPFKPGPVVRGPVLVRGKPHKIRTRLRFIEEEPTFLTPSTTPWTGHSADTRPDLGRLYPGMPTLHHRFYFPETWLWDTTRIGSSSRAVLTHALPHTITEWAGSTLCLHSTSGLGVAPITNIRAFQPFFISFHLPATVIRDEIIPLQVTVNSYLDECFELALRIELDDNLALEQGGVEEVICMCKQNTASLPYKIAPIDTGVINVTFSAAAVQDRGVCEWTDGHVVAMDKITKPLLVLPGGIEEEKTQTIIECVGGFAEEKTAYMNLTMPDHFVEESQMAYVTVTADVMGPTVENMHKLLRLPTGCGEQNMAKLATNVHVLSYLTNTGQLNKKREARAKTYIAQGYQKVLQFRRRDGSYSPFGAREPLSSLWLTAFAVRTFAAARAHTYVEQDAFQGSISWLQSRQSPSGCFIPSGMVHTKLMLGGGLNQTASGVALSAYIMAALLEAGRSRFSPVLERVVRCLDLQEDLPTEAYSLSLMMYAYSVYEPANSRRADCLTVLYRKATLRDGLVYWKVATTPLSPGSQADPVDIEVTAYVLLGLLASGTQRDLERGAPIVRWLTSQRNAQGGFASTQNAKKEQEDSDVQSDTVVAVEALSKYAARTFSHATNLVVTIDTPVSDTKFAIKPTTRLLAQRKAVPIPAGLQFIITGTGCALIQTVSRYNLPVMVKPRTYFALDVEVQRVPHPPSSDPLVSCPQHQCWLRRLEICTRYTGPSLTSQMAVIDVKMVSGWQPEDSELRSAFSNTSVMDYSYKYENSTLHIYFSSLNRQHQCLGFRIRQEFEVGNAKAAYARVYEYYSSTDVSRSQMYEIEEICTEEEKDTLCIPDVVIH